MAEKQIESIYATLSKIQAEFSVEKKRLNKFGGYRYRNLEDIFETFKTFAEKHGVSLIINDEIVLIGTEYFLKAHATLFNKDGQSIDATAFARHPLAKKGFDEAQLTGMTSSYARKYALNALFAIDDNQDADSQDDTAPTAHDRPQGKQMSQPQRQSPNTPDQVALLNDLIQRTNTDLTNVLKYFKAESLEFVNFENCKLMLEKKLESIK